MPDIKGKSTDKQIQEMYNQLLALNRNLEVYLNSQNKQINENQLASVKQFKQLSNVALSGSYNDLTNKPVVDTELSSTSTNAVQNKAIYAALAGKYHPVKDFVTYSNGVSASYGVVGYIEGTRILVFNISFTLSQAYTAGATTFKLGWLNNEVKANSRTQFSANLVGGHVYMNSGDNNFYLYSSSNIEAGTGISVSGAVITQSTFGETSDSDTEDNVVDENQLAELLSAYVTKSELAGMGYLTSYTEKDPTVPSYVKSISENDITNWNGKLEDIELTFLTNSELEELLEE